MNRAIVRRRVIEPDVPPTPLTFPRPAALINEYWRVVAAERRAMLRAWGKWLEQRPNPEHVEHQFRATVSAMRQMVADRGAKS